MINELKYYFSCNCGLNYFDEKPKCNCPKCKKMNFPKSFETYNKNKKAEQYKANIINIEV